MYLRKNRVETRNTWFDFGKISTVKQRFVAEKVNLLEIYEKNKRVTPGSFIIEMPYGRDRISVVCCEVLYCVRIDGEDICVLDSKNRIVVQETGDPLSFFKKVAQLFIRHTKGLDELAQSIFTLISYDAARQFEKKRLNIPATARIVPDFWAVVPKTVMIVNHTTGEGLFYLNSCQIGNETRNAQALLDKYLDGQANDTFESAREKRCPNAIEPVFNYSEEEFCQTVAKAKEYIKSGDIFQVVLSVECAVKTQQTAIQIYQNMLGVNHGTANYLIQSHDFSLIGASPEILVEKTGEQCLIKPLAGTLLHQGARDIAKENELLGNDKDCAEHRMLVDLARNDLGRVCKYNTVLPKKLMEVEYFYNVMHIVSEIKGLIKPEKDCYDLLKASFPAGTMTGAPKIRAMEIIDELETTIRGFYSGGVGFFTATGNLYSYIVIRSLTLIKDIAYARAGAGIVYDSVPEQEYQECLSKLRNALKAL